MDKIPFEVAKEICEKYDEDQCIILTWNKKNNCTTVVTYGVGDSNSVQATNGGKEIKDFLQLKYETNAIPDRFKKWEISNVEKYFYHSGRNSITYVEMTCWIDPFSLERKETTREAYISDGEEWKLPDWAKTITFRNRKLESSFY